MEENFERERFGPQHRNSRGSEADERERSRRWTHCSHWERGRPHESLRLGRAVHVLRLQARRARADGGVAEGAGGRQVTHQSHDT
ncbi:Protein of unknown function [Gryllus bimaculatus]|nr:Protein of unknown function [Gryllus bimaculatus]